MVKIKVADQGWVGLALLHREQPGRTEFRTEEVLARAEKEFGELAPGVQVHLSSHAVATAKPSPGTYKMVSRTGRGRLRLFRDGDPFHEGRTGKSVPRAEEVPLKYHDLLRWYEETYNVPPRTKCNVKDGDPRRLMRFVGSITAFDLDLMKRLIADDCERIEDESGEGKDVA